MNDKNILFGEEVTPVPNSTIIRYALVSLVWGWLASFLGLDAGIMAVTLLTSYVLSSIGFPLGLKYIGICVSTSLILSILVKGFMGAAGQ